MYITHLSGIHLHKDTAALGRMTSSASFDYSSPSIISSHAPVRRQHDDGESFAVRRHACANE